MCSTVASRSLLHSYKYIIYTITEARVYSQTSVHVRHITRRHIPRNSILPRARGENLNLTISQSEVNVSMADEYQHVSTHRNW